MKIYALIGLILWSMSLVAQQIGYAEYFIDHDPGPGNGTPVSFTPDDTLDLNLDIPANSLSHGIHQLVIRASDTSGVWSTLGKKVFFVTPVQAPNTTIIKAEFFIDLDPGIDNGSPLTFTADDTLELNAYIPVSTLPNGVHQLYVRAYDSGSAWSSPGKGLFIVKPDSIADDGIVKVEWFLDQDPGIDGGNHAVLTPGDTVDLNMAIPTDTLGLGLYKLFFRSQDSTGTWGSLYKKIFLVKKASASQQPLPEIVKVEYVFPGMEFYQGVSEMAVTGDSTVNNDLSWPTEPLESGLQTVLVRAKNDDGVWGNYVRSDTFTVLECELVTNTNDSGIGSFRFALDCTNQADTVWFDPSVHNQTIFMKLPKIVLEKEVFIRADTLSNITITNENINNTVVLLSTTKNLDIEGVNFVGQSPGSLIFAITPPSGGIYINGVLFENIIINIQ